MGYSKRNTIHLLSLHFTNSMLYNSLFAIGISFIIANILNFTVEPLYLNIMSYVWVLVILVIVSLITLGLNILSILKLDVREELHE